MVHIGRCIYIHNTYVSRQTMSLALYSISIKSKKIKESEEKNNVPVYLPTYLPILKRNVLFLSVFNVYQFLDIRKREREGEKKKRIRNVKTMISFNSGFLLLFIFPFLKSSSPITLGGKKEGPQITASKKKIDNNSKREQQQQQQKQEPGGFFWSFRQNILIIQSKWSIKKKSV